MQTGETTSERYLRQTRNATRLIAWIVAVFTILAIVGVILGVVAINHADSSTSACPSYELYCYNSSN